MNREYEANQSRQPSAVVCPTLPAQAGGATQMCGFSITRMLSACASSVARFSDSSVSTMPFPFQVIEVPAGPDLDPKGVMEIQSTPRPRRRASDRVEVELP